MPGSRSALGLLLFGGSDVVFYGFRQIELGHRLRGDLDRFAGLRIAAHARFALRLLQAAEAGKNEDAVFLGFFDRGVSQRQQKRSCCFIVRARLLSEVADQLCLCHACCHESSFRTCFKCEVTPCYISDFLSESVLPHFFRVFYAFLPRNLWKSPVFTVFWDLRQ